MAVLVRAGRQDHGLVLHEHVCVRRGEVGRTDDEAFAVHGKLPAHPRDAVERGDERRGGKLRRDVEHGEDDGGKARGELCGERGERGNAARGSADHHDARASRHETLVRLTPLSIETRCVREPIRPPTP
jgi:hypothetical protein